MSLYVSFLGMILWQLERRVVGQVVKGTGNSLGEPFLNVFVTTVPKWRHTQNAVGKIQKRQLLVKVVIFLQLFWELYLATQLKKMHVDRISSYLAYILWHFLFQPFQQTTSNAF